MFIFILVRQTPLSQPLAVIMIMKTGLLIAICFSLIGCSTVDSFDKDLMPIFKDFQRTVEANREKLKGDYFEIADGYHWIVKSNFKRSFPFMDVEQQRTIQALFDNEEISRIEIWDVDCILFKIKPNYDNQLLKDEWDILYIAYNNNCDCKCHEVINEWEIPQERVTKLEDKWLKVIAKGKRYIGG